MRDSDTPTSTRLEYNALLMKGYSSFQSKELPKALSFYQEAFKLNPQSLHGALVKSIVGVLYMHTCNYSEAISAFTDGLVICEKVEREQESRQERVNYEVRTSLCRGWPSR